MRKHCLAVDGGQRLEGDDMLSRLSGALLGQSLDILRLLRVTYLQPRVSISSDPS